MNIKLDEQYKHEWKKWIMNLITILYHKIYMVVLLCVSMNITSPIVSPFICKSIPESKRVIVCTKLHLISNMRIFTHSKSVIELIKTYKHAPHLNCCLWERERESVFDMFLVVFLFCMSKFFPFFLHFVQTSTTSVFYHFRCSAFDVRFWISFWIHYRLQL